MTVQVSAAPRRSHSWQPGWLLLDIALCGVLLVAGPHALARHGEPGWAPLLMLALVLPLLFRRRAPLTVFGLVSAAAFVQWLLATPLVADAALLVALYSVAVASTARRTLLACAVLEFGVVLAVLKYTGPQGGHTLAFIFLSGLVTAAGVLGMNVRVRRAYLHEVEERAARLELERDQQSQLAVAAERARVAREMHDIVAHNVSVMVALTDGAALTLRSDPARAATALGEASRAGRAALTDMRRVLGLLRDSGDAAALAPAPGIPELDGLLDAVRHTGYEVRYATSGPLTDLPRGVQLSAYRIVQEAITNTIKHADGAHRIDVQISADAAGIEVIVLDDGRPTIVPDATPGHGLVGMRERAAVHAGEVRAGPTSTGWAVRAWLPQPVAAVRTELATASA